MYIYKNNEKEYFKKYKEKKGKEYYKLKMRDTRERKRQELINSKRDYVGNTES